MQSTVPVGNFHTGPSLKNLHPSYTSIRSLFPSDSAITYQVSHKIPQHSHPDSKPLSQSPGISRYYCLVKYILRMCPDNSITWSNHVHFLCKIYSLPCPLYLLEHAPAWPKEKWTTLIKTRVTVHHETKLWLRAKSNSKMCYLNVQLLGLSGHPHPALLDIFTTQDVRKLRLHIKFLAGDFLTAERVALDQPQLSPMCKLCGVSVETASHVFSTMSSTVRSSRETSPRAVKCCIPSTALLRHPKQPISTRPHSVPT